MITESDVGGAPLRLVVGLGQVRPRHPAVDSLQVLDVGQDLVQLPCTWAWNEGCPKVREDFKIMEKASTPLQCQHKDPKGWAGWLASCLLAARPLW